VRILLDENIPHPLMRYLPGHEVATVQSRGWRGILNGELLRIADESFDVFILADKNMRYQQNMDGRRIVIIELPTNRWPLSLLLRRALPRWYKTPKQVNTSSLA
jgi:hypothetical protein